MKEKLTKTDKEVYVKHGGVDCPYCESDQLEGGFVEVCEGGATQPIHCLSCGKRWYDSYTLTDIEEEQACGECSQPLGDHDDGRCPTKIYEP